MTQRLYIVNFAAFAFMVWAWFNGSIERIAAADSSGMGAFITVLFAAGVVSVFWQARATGKAESLKQVRAVRIRSEHLGTLAAALFILGIVGNAQGLLHGFSGISLDALGTAEGAKTFGTQVLAGISSTFGATIIGSLLALWTLMNTQILFTKLALLELDAQ